jgi:hypothetical protein
MIFNGGNILDRKILRFNLSRLAITPWQIRIMVKNVVLGKGQHRGQQKDNCEGERL